MRTTHQRGQVYPLFALLLVSFIGLSSLAIDLGYWRYQERVQQTATDSAAIAAAQASVFPSPNAANAAIADVAANYPSPDPQPTISIQPNYSDAYTGSNSATQVTLVQQYPKFFSAFFGGGSQSIATTAVAELAATGSYCLTGLNPAGIMDLGGQKFAGSGCSIAANGAFECKGGNYGVLDNITVNLSETSNVSCNKYSNPVTYSSTIPDPCPYVAGCLAYTEATATSLGISCLPSSTTCTAPSCTNKLPVPTSGTVASGCYDNANFSNAVVFSGNYVFVNGVTFSANVSSSSNGASFYIASGALNVNIPGSNNGFGSAASPFLASTSGSYEGVLFFAPAANTSGASIQGQVFSVGMYYFPGGSYTEKGQYTHSYTGNLVFSSITFNGSNTTTLLPGSGSIDGQQTQVKLVE